MVMRLTIIGCGDAFGAGGRLQTSFHLRSGGGTYLIDCGVSTLIGMNRLGLKTGEIDAVFISHLHGDHFGGLSWLLIDGLYVSKRDRPLLITGPKGIEARFTAATEALYPGMTTAPRPFALDFIEYQEVERFEVAGVGITPFEVRHPSGAPPYALRLQVDGKVIAFTGDTGWTENLYQAANGADLLISECFQYDLKLEIHLDFKTIDANYARLGAKRVLLTHMGEAMLAHTDQVDASRYLLAEDGMILDL
jgi:ribonuclease BN (tRNA processing enzyme)